MKGIVYKISSPSTDKIYIGSTIQPLKNRFSDHKYSKDCSSKTIINYGNAVCDLIEDFECDDIKSLRDRESYYIQLNKDKCVNIIIPNRTKKQYQTDNAEKFKKYYQQYHIDNADKKKKISNQYYIDNIDKIKIKRSEKHICKCGIEYTCHNKARHLKTKKHQDFLKS